MKAKPTTTTTTPKTTKTKTPKTSTPPPCESECCCSTPTKEVTFEYYAPEAKQVTLAGTFNNWDSKQIPLKKEKTGRWSTQIALNPGCYEYKFVIDQSKWEPDQRTSQTTTNTYGSANSIIEVKKTM